MTSDANNCGTRLVGYGSFEFPRQRFSCTVVCEPFIFNLGLNGQRVLMELMLWIPILCQLILRAFNQRELKWLSAFHYLGSV